MRRKNTTSEMMKSYIAQSLFILMNHKALSDITIGEVTTKAGVNRATYYRHFESKLQIIQYYYAGILAEYAATLNGKEKVNLEEYLSGLFTHLMKYKKELLLIYQNDVSYLILETLKDLFFKTAIATSLETELAIHYHTGGIYGVFLLWFSHDMKENPAQMSKASVQVLSNQFVPMLLR